MQVKLDIWDTAGLEMLMETLVMYYSGAAGVLLVYDVSQRDKFNEMAFRLRHVRQHTAAMMPILLVGNKIDLQPFERVGARTMAREVSTEEGAAFVKEHNLLFVETSARAAANVEQAFFDIAQCSTAVSLSIGMHQIEVKKTRTQSAGAGREQLRAGELRRCG